MALTIMRYFIYSETLWDKVHYRGMYTYVQGDGKRRFELRFPLDGITLLFLRVIKSPE